MEAITAGPTMVNPSTQDEEKFDKIISLVDQMNDLRARALTLAYNITDRDLRRSATMLLGLQDEYARKL